MVIRSPSSTNHFFSFFHDNHYRKAQKNVSKGIHVILVLNFVKRMRRNSKQNVFEICKLRPQGESISFLFLNIIKALAQHTYIVL